MMNVSTSCASGSGVETTSQQEISPRRQTPNEQTEDRLFGHALFEICLQHRQLVQVGK